jgi:hypothetical protein
VRCHTYGHASIDCSLPFTKRVWRKKFNPSKSNEKLGEQSLLEKRLEVVKILDKESSNGVVE